MEVHQVLNLLFTDYQIFIKLADNIQAGGGINFTVDHTRAASEDKLYDLLEGRLKRMMSSGN